MAQHVWVKAHNPCLSGRLSNLVCDVFSMKLSASLTFKEPSLALILFSNVSYVQPNGESLLKSENGTFFSGRSGG